MRKFLPLLLLITIGTVFAIGLVNTNTISTGMIVNTGIETKSLSANNIIQSTTLPANFTIFASAVEGLGHEGASECINNNGKFELKCSDDSIIYTYASCLGAGYYDFGEETINMNTQSWSQSPNGYTVCVSEDFSILPDSLSPAWGIIVGGTYSSCEDIPYSSEFLDIKSNIYDAFASSSHSIAGPMQFASTTNGNMCMFEQNSKYYYLTDLGMNLVSNIYSTSNWNDFYQYLYDETDCEGSYDLATQQNIIKNSCKAKFLAKDYSSKCDLLSEFQNSGASNLNSFSVGGGGGNPVFNLQNNALTNYNFEPSEFTEYEGEWVSENEIITKCHENPINPNVDIYLKDYPDLTFEDGKWPAGTDLTLDAADSTPESVAYHWTGSTMNVFLNARESSVEILPNIGQSNLNLELTTADGAWTYDVPINLTIEDFFYVDIQTSLAGESVSPGTPFTFLLNAFTFDGVELESFIFDPGQREVGNGQFIDVAGEFQCKEAKTVQCLIDDAIYDGVPRLTGACGCPTNMNGAGTIYVGEKEGTKDDNAYSRKFDRDEFEYSFIMEYPSKTACGSDRVCQVELEITDVNGRTAEKIIELNLPAIQSCGAIYPNSITGDDSTQFVGQINDGEQSCECKTGYSPEFDALAATLTGESKFCEEDITEIEPILPIIPGIPTPPSNPNLITPPANSFGDFMPSTSDKNESSSALTTLLILMLVALSGIFGFEFYEKKKKGSYFNPFGKSKPKSKPATSISTSPIQKFISDAKKAGEDPAAIKQNLMNSGWPENEINKYI